MGSDAPTYPESLPETVGRSLYPVFFGRLTRLVAIPVLLLSFFLPPDGLGVPICWFKRIFDLPCPGCGLTRSVTCISQLKFAKAWDYHPFGFLAYMLFLVNAVMLFRSSEAKAGVQCWLVAHDDRVRPVYWTVVVAFLVFGIARMLVF